MEGGPERRQATELYKQAAIMSEQVMLTTLTLDFFNS